MSEFEAEGAGFAGRIIGVEGLSAEIGLEPGDELLAINDQPVRDIIDVQFLSAEHNLELLVRREGELWLFEVERDLDEPLGLAFENPTFDTDVRRCNNKCVFCFVAQMAPPKLGIQMGRGERFRRSLYIKDDDYRYSFLDGNYVTLTNLDERDWQRIFEQRLSPLYVSVHATERRVRSELLGNPTAPDVLEQLRRLAEGGIQVHTQLVIVPGVNDGEVLQRSVSELAGLWPSVQTASVIPVGLTRFHHPSLRPNTPDEAAAVLDRTAAWQEEFQRRLGERFVFASDEWYLLAGRPVPPLSHYPQLDALLENGVGLVSQFLDDWKRVKKKKAPKDTAGRVILVTGTLFAPILRQTAEEFGAKSGRAVEVRAIANTVLGETITVAGLLTGRDVVEQLGGVQPYDSLVLPAVMFRGPGGVSLDGMAPEDIGRVLGVESITAEFMSDLFGIGPI